jgi:hypothetical protein
VAHVRSLVDDVIAEREQGPVARLGWPICKSVGVVRVVAITALRPASSCRSSEPL